MIFPRLERESPPVFAQPRVSLDEILFAHPQKRCQSHHFRVRQPHFARPAATRGAAVTLEVDFHTGIDSHGKLMVSGSRCNRWYSLLYKLGELDWDALIFAYEHAGDSRRCHGAA